MKAKFNLNFVDVSGRNPPKTATIDWRGDNIQDFANVTDGVQSEIGKFNVSLFAEHVETIKIRLARLKPILERLEAGEDFEEVMGSASPEDMRLWQSISLLKLS